MTAFSDLFHVDMRRCHDNQRQPAPCTCTPRQPQPPAPSASADIEIALNFCHFYLHFHTQNEVMKITQQTPPLATTTSDACRKVTRVFDAATRFQHVVVVALVVVVVVVVLGIYNKRSQSRCAL